ncbi:hypothetical protein F5Y19DRAFT_376712 [Xylariaceae sp. FL1651]|nr:hypothetical protein F5Y19DRAFT_376712 [Xylariaceae sp. FL1651]
MSERKPCHNCRRRRLRCDRSVPGCYKCAKTGQRCLGYGKLYRWASSEASGGQAGHRRGDALTSSTQCDSLLQHKACGDRSYIRSTLTERGPSLHRTLNIALADPLLQDLSASSRYYLSYFASRFCQDLVVHDSVELGTNPFRELIPMSQAYSFLQNIIIAVSAVHYYHAIRYASSNIAPHSRLARKTLIDALHARQEAIQELIAMIERRRSEHDLAQSQAEQDALLATVLFFVNFALIDSGKDGWRNHLTAAGRLLSVYAPSPLSLSPLAFAGAHVPLDSLSPTSLEITSLSKIDTPRMSLEVLPQPTRQPPTACDYVASDTIAYFIWNCALESLVSSPSPSSSSPSAHSPDYAAQPSTWDVAKVMRILLRTEANSYHSCPSYLMGIVLQTARTANFLKSSGNRSPTTSQMNIYLNLLKDADTFDIESWAAGVSTHTIGVLGVMDKQEMRMRCHIAATYRAAVCLYILLVAPGLPAEVRRRARYINSGDDALPTLPTPEDLALTILQQLSFIPKTSPFFKFTTWPVFLTGVEAASAARRLWVMERLRGMRDLCPWGMLTSAMETLTEIWTLRDGATEHYIDNDDLISRIPRVAQSREDRSDWLTRLRGLRIDCLIV